MNFYIATTNDNGSGMKYNTKEDFIKKISIMIDDCVANGGRFFDVQVDSDVDCFSKKQTNDSITRENYRLDDILFARYGMI